METQQEPRFRPRLMPMPKVGDKIIDMYGNISVVSGYNKWEPSLFSTVLSDGKPYCYDATDTIWGFADPAVEAQRLQEAAWRADTSPLPQWLTSLVERLEASKFPHVNIGRLLRNAMADNPEDTDFIIEAVPHLLRWQAQQEGGKHE